MFRLEQNYRSTKNIVGAANSVIEHNKTKLDKVVWTANDAGEKVDAGIYFINIISENVSKTSKIVVLRN